VLQVQEDFLIEMERQRPQPKKRPSKFKKGGLLEKLVKIKKMQMKQL